VHARSSWLVYLSARVGGRRLLRPAVGLASVLFGSRVRDDLRRRLEEAPDFTGELERQFDELRSQISAESDHEPSADEQARAALATFLAGVVEDPDGRAAGQ
jgi:hypothetical protein